MSKLDELIRELCPDGVEYKKLGEIATVLRGASPRPIKKYITNDSDGVNWIKIGDVPVGSKYITQSEEKITKEGAEKSRYVRKGDFILSNSMSFGRPYILAIDGCIHDGWLSISNFKDVFLSDYLYYLLSSSAIQQEMKKRASFGGAVQNLNADIVKALVLPVPPIEVQSEIVRILDDYTENVVELQNQLALEITARQRQYTFYRNKLLTFSGNEKAKIVKISLGDIGPICMCKRILKSQTNTVEGVPFYKIGTFGKKADAYISKETFDEYRSKYSFPKKGDVLISAAGTIGRTVVYDGKPAYFQDSNIVWIDNNESVVLNSYLRYCYELKPWKVSSGGTIQRLYNDNIAKAIITVPSLDVQNRIVNVLDNFEKICSDLNIGLPAEIEAWQKQYEYYRDKLLTFAETGNTILSRAEQSRAEQSRAEQSRALIKLLQYVFGYAAVSLQDVVKKSCSGGTPKKGVSEYYEAGNIPWLRTREVVFRDIYRTECFITESAVKNSAAKWIPKNCVIVAISGATAGRCAINKIPLTTNQHCLNLEVDPEMALYRYVYYCICAKQEELLAKKEGARGDLNSTRILSLQIDLPALEEQKRIVSILDRFDTICNDLTSGLPAEIEARQKQYEYYRDKLLTFEERG